MFSFYHLIGCRHSHWEMEIGRGVANRARVSVTKKEIADTAPSEQATYCLPVVPIFGG